jgi:hypothetical protein
MTASVVVADIHSMTPPFIAETSMRKGQRVRLRASARAAHDWGVVVGAEGDVLCEYKLLSRLKDRDCVDVNFGAGMIVWGAPSAAFEEIGEPPHTRGT